MSLRRDNIKGFGTSISHLKIRRVQYGVFSFVLALTSLVSISNGELNWESYLLFIVTGFILGLFVNTWLKIKDIEEGVKK